MPALRTCQGIFSAALGSVLGLGLLKFGNPVILDSLIPPPSGLWEWVLSPWPIVWGYAGLCLVLLVSLPVLRVQTRVPLFILLLPAAWLAWQALAATQTIDPGLTRITLTHFAACTLLFYLGLFGLGRFDPAPLFWLPLLIAFSLVLWFGFDQHNGSLEATRKMFFERPDWQQYPPELIKRMSTGRIFGTLFYPNALASLILLLSCPLLFQLWTLSPRWPRVARAIATGLLAYLAVACFYWTGSKSAWLIAVVLTSLLALRLPLQSSLRGAAAALLLAAGLLGFWLKYEDYLTKGATSAMARSDYWRAAIKTTLENPALGSGPGTFSITYARNKRPEAEMSRLAHNDYLQQASDSGIPAALLYAAVFIVPLVWIQRRIAKDPLLFLTSLGLIAWALHGLFEFGLYIPALSWTAFALLGYACQRASIGLDTPRHAR